MAGKDFSDLGRMEAIRALYEGTPYEAFGQNRFEAPGREFVAYASKVMLEGIDFDIRAGTVSIADVRVVDQPQVVEEFPFLHSCFQALLRCSVGFAVVFEPSL